MLILLWGAAALACSITLPDWGLPEPGAHDVPTDTLLFGGGYFTDLRLRRADDGAEVAVSRVRHGGWSMDAHDPVIRRPRDELDPATVYEVLWDDDVVSTFTTGAGPSEDAPDPPVVAHVEVDHVRRDSCSSGGRYVHFTIEGEGMLLVTGDEHVDLDPERPLAVGGVYADLFLDDEEEIIHPLEYLGEEVRFGFIDQTGAWSGWSDPVDLHGCGCAAGGGHRVSAWLALALAALLRRASWGRGPRDP